MTPQGAGLILQHLEVVVGLAVLVLPAGLDDDAGAEDQRHQEDGVPQLLQVLLRGTASARNTTKHSGKCCKATPHLDLGVALSCADDPLPLPVEPPPGATAAGPQRERGPALPGHTAASASSARAPLGAPAAHSPGCPAGWSGR